ncbi:unnamed protein product [Urochloa decumbens]|uniref:Uncharacterized protein n=1 Tax=Urochloa decumbens TaxID=240449 RepID=A0ABC9GDC4_9POAL
MASKRLLIVAVLAVFAALPTFTAGLNVGNDKRVDGNQFVVGDDTQVFKYSAAVATEAGVVAACSAVDRLVVWAASDGRVALNMSGQWWFFSGGSVQLGMKFNVTVLQAAEELTSSPPPPVRAQSGGVAASVLAAGAVAVGVRF